MTTIDRHVGFEHISSIGTHFLRITRLMHHAPHLKEHWNLKLKGPYHFDIEGGGRYYYRIKERKAHHEIWADGLHVKGIIGMSGPEEVIVHQGDLDKLAECAARIERMYKDMKAAAPRAPVP